MLRTRGRTRCNQKNEEQDKAENTRYMMRILELYCKTFIFFKKLVVYDRNSKNWFRPNIRPNIYSVLDLIILQVLPISTEVNLYYQNVASDIAKLNST